MKQSIIETCDTFFTEIELGKPCLTYNASLCKDVNAVCAAITAPNGTCQCKHNFYDSDGGTIGGTCYPSKF